MIYICPDTNKMFVRSGDKWVPWHKNYMSSINQKYPVNTAGLTDKEVDELLAAFDEAVEKNRAPEVPITVPVCTCEINTIMRTGCRCGAFAAEMMEIKRKKRLKKKAIEADMKKGMSYDERVKKYGEG